MRNKLVGGMKPVVVAENSSADNIADSESFTGKWKIADSCSIMLAIYADQDLTYKVQFSPDGTNIDSTLTFSYENGVIEQPKRIVVTRQYYRVVVTNDSGSDTTIMRLQTLEGEFNPLTTPMNANITRDHGALVTRVVPPGPDVVSGRFVGLSYFPRFGRNADIDTGAGEDLIAEGGTYAGFPTGAPEEFEIVLGSADDVGSIVTFRYLASSTATEWTWASITTTGTSTDTGITGFRAPQGWINTTGSTTAGAVNAGTVTLRHKTTTANIFFVIGVGEGQTRSTADSIPAGNSAMIERIRFEIEKLTNANITGHLWYRKLNESPRLIYPGIAKQDSASNQVWANDKGPLLAGFADIVIQLNAASANNTPVIGDLDYTLIRN